MPVNKPAALRLSYTFRTDSDAPDPDPAFLLGEEGPMGSMSSAARDWLNESGQSRIVGIDCEVEALGGTSWPRETPIETEP